MVWKVRTISCMVAILLLVCAVGTRAQAATYDVYDGNPSSTYQQYFRDLVGGLSFNDNYVAFRSGQNTYVMVVGDLVYNNGLFTSENSCKVYTFTNTTGTNSYYRYDISSISSFYLDAEDKIVYSDLGDYPQFEERSAKYEILTAILVVAVIVGYAFRGVFRYRPR